MKRTGFTLVELLVSVAITATALSFAGIIFTKGWTASARMVRQAEHRQLDYLLSRLWQDALRGSDPTGWQISSNMLVCGEKTVSQDGDRLVITTKGAVRRLRLPADTTCSFAVERPENLAPYAVLTVVHREGGAAGPQTRSAHFVACGRRP